jgi:hypothetical protein
MTHILETRRFQFGLQSAMLAMAVVGAAIVVSRLLGWQILSTFAELYLPLIVLVLAVTKLKRFVARRRRSPKVAGSLREP